MYIHRYVYINMHIFIYFICIYREFKGIWDVLYPDGVVISETERKEYDRLFDTWKKGMTYYVYIINEYVYTISIRIWIYVSIYLYDIDLLFFDIYTYVYMYINTHRHTYIQTNIIPYAYIYKVKFLSMKMS
jgi:hypothetical protein